MPIIGPPDGQHDRLDDPVGTALDELELRFLLDPDTVVEPPGGAADAADAGEKPAQCTPRTRR